MADSKTKSRFDPLMLLCLAGAAVMAWLELAPPVICEDALLNQLLIQTLTRVAGIAVFAALALRCRYRVYRIMPENPKTLLLCLPALLVVINNLPIIGLISGRVSVDEKGIYLLVYALQSLSIGLFEELAFRAVLFPAVLEGRRKSTKSIFLATVLSSLVFGGIHLFNLFAGGSPLSVLLQIGYSFLIGGMCAVVMLKTRCLWICVLLHTLFDFNGYLVSYLGYARFLDIWDPVTIAITAVLGCLTLVHYLFVMKKVTPEEADRIYKK